jgi:hypothetical protein
VKRHGKEGLASWEETRGNVGFVGFVLVGISCVGDCGGIFVAGV